MTCAVPFASAVRSKSEYETSRRLAVRNRNGQYELPKAMWPSARVDCTFLQRTAGRGCHPSPAAAPRTLVPVKTTKLPSAPPMEANDVAIVTGGTVLWLVGFVVLLPFHGWLADHGDTKWLWT